jgi:Flp pilus assembly protein TadG
VVRRRQEGQALVEYALTALVLITAVIFLLDGGRILWNWVTVSEAARAGARYAITHGAYADAPQGPGNDGAVRAAIAGWGFGLDRDTLLSGDSIQVTWQGNSNHPGQSVTVEIAYPVRPLTALFWGGAPVTLRAGSTMEIEN